MKIQDADAIKSQISNIELLQQLETIQGIKEPEQRADTHTGTKRRLHYDGQCTGKRNDRPDYTEKIPGGYNSGM